MGKETSSKCKKCRRSREKLFLKGDRCNSPKCAMIRKAYAPGVHGKKFSRGVSEFGKQLAMKQKIKRIYGVMERQFRKHFDEIKNKKGVIGDLFMARLEMRLDNVVYRSGFASSRSQARQLVNHGFVKLNGKKINVSSCWVKVGDIISINETKLEKNYTKNQKSIIKKIKNNVTWMSIDVEKIEIKILAIPTREGLDLSVDPQMVVEYYSR